MLSLKIWYKFASLLVCNHAKSSLCYSHADGKHEYCNDFDLRKPLERHFLSSQHIDCVSIQETQDLAALRNRCATFLTQFPRYCWDPAGVRGIFFFFFFWGGEIWFGI